MGNCIGIDLGTTNSVGAFKFTQVEVATDEAGKGLTRSVVALNNGEIVVGDKAYYQLKQDPENEIALIQYQTALTAGLNGIMTRNPKDYARVSISVLTPTELLVAIGEMLR